MFWLPFGAGRGGGKERNEEKSERGFHEGGEFQAGRWRGQDEAAIRGNPMPDGPFAAEKSLSFRLGLFIVARQQLS